METDAAPSPAPPPKIERAPPSPREPSRTDALTRWTSILALAVSFLAFAVGAYQTRLMQTQARASVWPFVEIGYTYFGSGENAGFVWRVDNDGVGPARLGWVALSLDGKPMRRWLDVYDALGLHDIDFATLFSIGGKVLPPNTNRETTIAALRVTDPAAAKTFFDARKRFAMSICYCSVYDECWIAQWEQHRVEAAATCDAPPAVPFEQ